jgi:hypothetical protein
MKGDAVAIGVVVAEAIGNPHFEDRLDVGGRGKVQLEVGCEDSDDLQALRAVGHHGISQNGGIEAEAALRRRRLRQAVGIAEIAAGHDFGAHQAKEIGGNHCGVDLLGRSVFFEEDIAGSEDAGHVLEGVFGAVAHVNEVFVGEGEVADVAIAHVAGGDDQAVGILVGKGPQQHGIHDTEDSGARSDAQGNCQCGSEREDRTFPQCSACKCQIS